MLTHSTGSGSAGIEELLIVEYGHSGWARVDVRTERDELGAVTNPIFYGVRSEPSDLAYGQFVEESPRELGELLREAAT